jgi:hypothetical protein
VQIRLLRFRDSQPPFTPKQHSQSLDEQRFHCGFWLELGNEAFKQALKGIVVLMPRNEVIAKNAMPNGISAAHGAPLWCAWSCASQCILAICFSLPSSRHVIFYCLQFVTLTIAELFRDDWPIRNEAIRASS